MGKVLFVTGSLIRGGAERVTSILSNDYAKRGWDVTVVMVLHSYIGYELDPRIKIIDISNDKKPIYLTYPSTVLKLRKIIKDTDPDAVVSLMWNVCLISGVANIGLRKKLITSERNDPSKTGRSFFKRKAIEAIYANSHCCVLQTKRVASLFPEKVQKKSVIIPNPIEVNTVAKYGNKRVISCGRLTEQKNQKMLIEAFSRISKDFPEWTLDIYGEGPLKEKLLSLSKEKGLESRITLKGNVANFHEEIRDAELFVLSSDYEGLSNALLEAMMMGLPCISTDCAGSDEVIDNMENGILIPVGDTEALKDAMAKLMSDRELSMKLGKAAAASSQRYSSTAVIGQWREVIED